MLHFLMFVTTKANAKLDNEKTGHAQVIGIILCCFTNFPIIYTVGPVYYFPGHPYSTIPLSALKYDIGFKKVISEPLEYCYFVDPRGRSWGLP